MDTLRTIKHLIAQKDPLLDAWDDFDRKERDQRIYEMRRTGVAAYAAAHPDTIYASEGERLYGNEWATSEGRFVTIAKLFGISPERCRRIYLRERKQREGR